MKQCFMRFNFKTEYRHLIDQANTILDEYMTRRMALSVRGLHYQFVARRLYENTAKSYGRLKEAVKKGRLAGEIDWHAIEDGSRRLRGGWNHWDSIDEFVKDAVAWYSIDYWREQPFYAEVWIEKEGLIGVIEPVCNRLGVPYYSTHGYDSKTPSYWAGRRFREKLDQGQMPLVLHLADHDPEGVHMTEFIRSELAMFAGCPVEVRRLGLTIEQANRFALPPNFAKETSTRQPDYIKQFGTNECWELDALPPEEIERLIDEALRGMIDWERWDSSRKLEKLAKDRLKHAAKNWIRD